MYAGRRVVCPLPFSVEVSVRSRYIAILGVYGNEGKRTNWFSLDNLRFFFELHQTVVLYLHVEARCCTFITSGSCWHTVAKRTPNATLSTVRQLRSWLWGPKAT